MASIDTFQFSSVTTTSCFNKRVFNLLRRLVVGFIFRAFLLSVQRLGSHTLISECCIFAPNRLPRHMVCSRTPVSKISLNKVVASLQKLVPDLSSVLKFLIFWQMAFIISRSN